MKETIPYGYLLDRAVKAERLDLNHRFKKIGIDLTSDQWNILRLLYESENGLSQNQLAISSFKDAPTVSRIIDLICKKGFATRKPFDGDRRRHQVVISTKGIETVKSALPEVEKNKALGWVGFDDLDLDKFIKIVNKVYSNYSS